jgi:dipeptidyl aminopeptidase/acylaminoacyl peptidase
LREPYDWEQYSQVFRPVGDGLFEKARAAEEAGHLDEASEYYLRSCTVWFIARFPRPLCESQAYAWKKQKEACIKGIRLGGLPVEEVNIPHKTAVAGEDTTIPAFFSVPDGASKARPVPVVVGICGLDAWRTELVALAGMLRRQGVAMVVVEVPGTGDSPALPGDPESPDRQWSSVLDWLDEHEAIDSRKVVAWGISTGGYYAMRVAHTHASRLLGVVSHGGGCHHMFDERWLESVDKREYPHR